MEAMALLGSSTAAFSAAAAPPPTTSSSVHDPKSEMRQLVDPPTAAAKEARPRHDDSSVRTTHPVDRFRWTTPRPCRLSNPSTTSPTTLLAPRRERSSQGTGFRARHVRRDVTDDTGWTRTYGYDEEREFDAFSSSTKSARRLREEAERRGTPAAAASAFARRDEAVSASRRTSRRVSTEASRRPERDRGGVGGTKDAADEADEAEDESSPQSDSLAAAS
mmetsp:Transcript_29657/g.87962  ORF Transcript_29657/g.87962 Transcript_29657/m.87962 type:complete len:220 (+) Transcript_29657:2041-2700(+)